MGIINTFMNISEIKFVNSKQYAPCNLLQIQWQKEKKVNNSFINHLNVQKSRINTFENQWLSLVKWQNAISFKSAFYPKSIEFS